MAPAKLLLSIVELGGYPNFSPLYQSLGYTTVVENRMRKAIAFLRRQQPDVIVTEFNFQSDFRDRTSSLESLLAVVQRLPDTRVVVFALAFPVSEDDLRGCLLGLDGDAGIDA